ncbi:hypothetical protein BCR34DRAFT_589079 [Clohesyomyces aquaticus]|uniref:Uncharacterized protein n=1 Tax=Clohesyomyces aquaticus TaxID=1231657 RepID=A0A1Y1ZHL3_9PLEO|nr:hypothetical protein BCR34DRAFT_589079 [Clohesyomyces aquaticus]
MSSNESKTRDTNRTNQEMHQVPRPRWGFFRAAFFMNVHREIQAMRLICMHLYSKLTYEQLFNKLAKGGLEAIGKFRKEELETKAKLQAANAKLEARTAAMQNSVAVSTAEYEAQIAKMKASIEAPVNRLKRTIKINKLRIRDMHWADSLSRHIEEHILKRQELEAKKATVEGKSEEAGLSEDDSRPSKKLELE